MPPVLNPLFKDTKKNSVNSGRFPATCHANRAGGCSGEQRHPPPQLLRVTSCSSLVLARSLLSLPLPPPFLPLPFSRSHLLYLCVRSSLPSPFSFLAVFTALFHCVAKSQEQLLIKCCSITSANNRIHTPTYSLFHMS